ncbi:NAD(P)-dependent alcohol dehydrogenase [Spirochaeta cellobiosiphila]|uniref:NAD(P)-dependent alcohol dehydrogenase n=1 Tax=Spirochaeta cellobiosiphila TaxID=504483 RepID=UPI0004107A6F|nr:NAD(P)-dependent alcohol dehydrogenase [Spirochaeta cellobiosiphila]
MEVMKSYVCHKYGKPEVLKLTQSIKPRPTKGQLLIKVYATSVTNSDIFIRSSKVGPGLLIPFRLMIGLTRPRRKIIGQVFAGQVEAVVDGDSAYKVGDKVYGLTGYSLGAYADYLCLAEQNSKQGVVAPMPDNISYEQATAAAYGGLLALQFLDKRKISEGDKVLLYGSASTSGLVALQYLKHLGAEVTSVCSESKFPVVQSYGADKLIDYRTDSSVEQLESYHIVFDCVGKAKTSVLKKELHKHHLDKNAFLSIDDEALLLSTNRLLKIKKLVEEGVLTFTNDKVYPFDKMIEAHHYVEGGHKTGNVAVTVNEE